jgi:pimeloyl-ACP methyl ester carboxylesterase
MVMEDCGHAPFVEKPDEFDRILHDLLARYDHQTH